jgi:hypothetical protein
MYQLPTYINFIGSLAEMCAWVGVGVVCDVSQPPDTGNY